MRFHWTYLVPGALVVAVLLLLAAHSIGGYGVRVWLDAGPRDAEVRVQAWRRDGVWQSHVRWPSSGASTGGAGHVTH
jgi:hypothetical protein